MWAEAGVVAAIDRARAAVTAMNFVFKGSLSGSTTCSKSLLYN
jgi:hypothetical protein